MAKCQHDAVVRLEQQECLLDPDAVEVTTVEGLGLQSGGCHPLQDAFDRHDAAQCGFCTPGSLMSAEALLRRVKAPVDGKQVREALAGNLCRCTGYTKIIDAVIDASETMYGPTP